MNKREQYISEIHEVVNTYKASITCSEDTLEKFFDALSLDYDSHVVAVHKILKHFKPNRIYSFNEILIQCYFRVWNSVFGPVVDVTKELSYIHDVLYKHRCTRTDLRDILDSSLPKMHPEDVNLIWDLFSFIYIFELMFKDFALEEFDSLIKFCVDVFVNKRCYEED